jgi:Leucine-rich repeat (LRR) protein
MYRSGIRELYLNKNHYVEVDYFKYDPPPPTLSILDMSDNKLTSFEFDILYFSKLNLQNNTLGRFLSSHVYMASSRTNLKEINLSFNGIFELAPSMFHNHPNLQLINVSNNLLTGIAFDLPDDMPLQTLDLSYNKIRVIDKATMDVIDKLARKSKLMINLSNNDLQCDCQAIYFLQWMVKNEEYFFR